MSERVAIGKIRLDGGTQSRASIDADTVARYVEVLGNGKKLPEIAIFFDGTDYWCADGFHRVKAWTETGAKTAPCEVHQGDRRDAVLYSVGANDAHGKPRTNADKRRAVMLLLSDEEWQKKSDRWIAEKCLVSNNFVGSLRPKQLSSDDSSKPRTGKDGKARALPKPKPAHEPKAEAEETLALPPEPQPEPEPAPWTCGKCKAVLPATDLVCGNCEAMRAEKAKADADEEPPPSERRPSFAPAAESSDDPDDDGPATFDSSAAALELFTIAGRHINAIPADADLTPFIDTLRQLLARVERRHAERTAA